MCCWRRERDSNPRVLAHKLISSQPRYDHFDISAYMFSSVGNKTSDLIFSSNGEPRYVLPVYPKFSARCSLRKISTAATPFCSLHPPPAAVANVPTSISLHKSLPVGLSQPTQTVYHRKGALSNLFAQGNGKVKRLKKFRVIENSQKYFGQLGEFVPRSNFFRNYFDFS